MDYLAAGFAAIMWAALVVMNIGFALHQSDPVWRAVGCVFFGAFDVGAIGFVPLMFKRHHDGLPSQAAAFAILWMVSCGVECFGAYSALKGYSDAAMAPSLHADEQRRSDQKELDEEKANLTEIRKQLKEERRVSLVEALRDREKASQKRIDELRPKTFVATVAPAHEWWTGFEAQVVFALWLLSQIAVYGVTGRPHGMPEAPVITVSPRVRRDHEFTITGRRETQTVLLPDERDSERDAERDRQQDRTGQATRQLPVPSETRDETDTDPDGPSGGGHPVEKTKKDTVSEQDKTGRDRLRLVVAGTCQGNETASETLNGTDSRRTARETPRQAPSGARQATPEQDSFDRRVSDLKRAGFSVREIVSKLETTKSKVEASLKRAKKDATKGRA